MPNIPPRHHGTAEDLFRLLDQREAAAHGGYSQDPGNWHGREGWRGAPAIGTPGGYAHQVGGFYPMWGLKGGYIGLNPAGRAFNAPEGLGGYGYSHGQAQPSPTGEPGAANQDPLGNPTMGIAARQRMLQQQLTRGQSGPMDPSQALAVQMLRRRLMGA